MTWRARIGGTAVWLAGQHHEFPFARSAGPFLLGNGGLGRDTFSRLLAAGIRTVDR
jgi:hypothetical protein